MKAKVALGPKFVTDTGWTRGATVDGTTYTLTISKRRVRLLYRQHKFGFNWLGFVYKGSVPLFADCVPAGTSAVGLLRFAGVVR